METKKGKYIIAGALVVGGFRTSPQKSSIQNGVGGTIATIRFPLCCSSRFERTTNNSSLMNDPTCSGFFFRSH